MIISIYSRKFLFYMGIQGVFWMKGCKGVGERKWCRKKFGVANVLCSPPPEYASDCNELQNARMLKGY